MQFPWSHLLVTAKTDDAILSIELRVFVAPSKPLQGLVAAVKINIISISFS